jgi:putative pyruvate formate lyase activating enzyme
MPDQKDYIYGSLEHGGYENRMLLRRSGYADIFLTDLKYMDEALSAKYSGAADYPFFAKSALYEW